MLVRTQLRVNNKEFVNHVVQTSCVRPAQNAIIMVTVVEYRTLFYMIIIFFLIQTKFNRIIIQCRLCT